MIKRLVDVILATIGLVLTAPLLALAVLGIRITTGGPAIFRARRVGRGGRLFTMYKLRTMRAATSSCWSRVTATRDARVFPLGRWLRRLKLDELPQLVNVLRGEMSVVGPRPEDPDFVDHCYAPVHRETLIVRPGLTSPGTLYEYTRAERVLFNSNAERCYIEHLLPVKLAIDRVYVQRASVRYDLAIMARTAVTMAAVWAGRHAFPDPPELALAKHQVVPVQAMPTSSETVDDVVCGTGDSPPWQP